MQGILNRQDALVPSSPSFVVLLGSAEQWQVANDSPGYSWDAEVKFVISRARRVKTVNLDAVFARAAYKRPSATLVGNCQLGSLTTGSPAGHLNHNQLIEGVSSSGCISLVPPTEGAYGTLLAVVWWLNVQSGLQDPRNNTLGILQSA